MRFWLEKGVDGFRVDVIWHLIKDIGFRDNPPNPYFHDGRPPHERMLTRYSTDQPEVHDVIAEMRRVTDEFGSRVLIGEVYLPLHRLVAYYGNDLAGAQMPFNFALLSTLWSARSIERIIAEYERALPAGAWPNWVLGNHDRPRVASRVGPEQARVAAMLLLTLRGTPTLYYGDEIGMHQVAIAPDQVRDPFEKNVPGIGQTLADKARTLVETGQLPQLEKLRQETPAVLHRMTRIPGLGVKKALVLHRELGINSLEELQTACQQERVRGLKGFGAKTEAAILAGLSIAQAASERLRLDQVEHLELRLRRHLADLKAIERMNAFQPQLVMLDWMMPGLDGPALFRKMRETAETKALPVVFITAKASERELNELRTMGAIGTISKPFSPKDLPEQLRALWKSVP